MGSVATTHKEKYREPFAPVMPGVEFVALQRRRRPPRQVLQRRLRHLHRAHPGRGRHPSRLAGVLRRPPANSATPPERFCSPTRSRSGLGRTGKWFAYQHYGILPDVTTLAKPIANGIPMGAMLCTNAAAQAFTPGMHGTTFGGGPLACAVAIAVIDTIKTRKHPRTHSGHRQVLPRRALQASRPPRLHRRRPRHGSHARPRTQLRRPRQADRRADDGAPHHHQPHQRNRPSLPSAFHPRAQTRRHRHPGPRRDLTAAHVGAAPAGEHHHG